MQISPTEVVLGLSNMFPAQFESLPNFPEYWGFFLGELFAL